VLHIYIYIYIYDISRLRVKKGAQDSHLQRLTIPEAAHIQLRRGSPDDEQG